MHSASGSNDALQANLDKLQQILGEVGVRVWLIKLDDEYVYIQNSWVELLTVIKTRINLKYLAYNTRGLFISSLVNIGYIPALLGHVIHA